MPNSQGFVVSQSAWAMDAVENFEISPIYTAANANSGAAGELQNDYTIVHGNVRFQNNYSLSCSNLGITWNPASPASNPPTFSNGTGIQMGFTGSSSTSSLPAAGNYKLGSEWATELQPSNGFTLSAWILPISTSLAQTSELGPESNIYIQDWPIFHFQRRDYTGGFATYSGTGSESGSIYFGLVKDAIGVGFPASNAGMSENYRIAAYTTFAKLTAGPTYSFIADKAYSNTIYSASPSLTGNTPQHVVMVYDPYESGGPAQTRTGPNRLKVYVNGSPISLTFDSVFGEAAIPVVDGPTAYSPTQIGNSCFIGNAKRDSEHLFNGGTHPSQIPMHIFNGLIDEPSVWSRPLDDSEVGQLYNGGKTFNLNSLSFASGNLISWWRCGDETGDAEGDNTVGLVNDVASSAFVADAANITEMISGVPVSSSIGVDSGSIVFSTTGTVEGQLLVANSAPLYNRKQTLQSVYSVVDRHGVSIPERNPEILNLETRWADISDCSVPYLEEAPLGSIQPYGGNALWEADRLAGFGNPFVSSPRSPFYDSYDDYSLDTKYAFKEGTILSEFRISEKIEEYVKNEDFLLKSCDNLSIFGIPTSSNTNPQNSSEDNFSKFYTNSEFMKFFDVVVTDHKGAATPNEITIKCKGLKKFIPYDGFYPSERSLQIASQFSKSYSQFIETVGGTDSDIPAEARNRPIMASLFSPGIMYNSIKAGIAVDYPVSLESVDKFEYKSYVSGATELLSSGYRALGTGSNGTNGWDYRVPFEALLEPEEYLKDKNITDMEPDLSCSLNLVSKLGQSGDNLYKLMMNNFLAEIPEFFLRNNEFTAIRSIPDNSKDFGKVEAGKTYGMRVKMRRSMNKTRRWFHPILAPSQSVGIETISGYEIPQDPIYQPDLKETFTMYSRPSAFGPPVAATGELYNPTTGSLGPAASYAQNRQSWSTYTCSLGRQNQDLYPSDSLNGYNPSFTPPYYNGEAWADILYTAPLDVTGNVSLDDILNNSKIIYWRIDGRPILRFRYKGQNFATVEQVREWNNTVTPSLPIPYSGIFAYSSWAPSTSSSAATGFDGKSAFLTGDDGTGWYFWGASSIWNGYGDYPMAPLNANKFAMQLSASVNLLGREDVLVQDFSPDGVKSQESTVNLSGRWVIQPKFETPMFNFGDESIRPISSASNTLTIPESGSESVPRGMWHQYGCLPRPNEGIYLEVSDIPEKWVEFRGAFTGSEKVLGFISPGSPGSGDEFFTPLGLGEYQSEYYSDYGAGNGVLSLMDVAGFTQVSAETEIGIGKVKGTQKRISKKLGQLREGKTVSEAIVAIPFYVENGNQKLFSISSKKIQAIIDQQNGITPKTEVDILSQIGPSLYDLVEKMQKFVLPPRYDFVNYEEVRNNPEIGAFAMYIFEFNHTFTTEDLSYIWQNVMPDAGLKSVFDDPETESLITHSLDSRELLDAEDFQKEIRWHVFKVKQRAAKNYFEKTTANKLGSSSKKFGIDDRGAPSYNWPYDFFSLIELGNMETQVTLKKDESEERQIAEASPDFKFPQFNYKENK